MEETVQLVIFETESIPQGYLALEKMTEKGLEPLEFYPHSGGVRVIFKANKDLPSTTFQEVFKIEVSNKIIKAMLSQTNNVLRKFLIVMESKSLKELLTVAVEFDKIGADILEIRSLRSNLEKNFALVTLDNKSEAVKILGKMDHAFLASTSKALREFLAFK
jgi:hypothetical protein